MQYKIKYWKSMKSFVRLSFFYEFIGKFKHEYPILTGLI